jgi:hypothetical protein
MFHNKSCKQSIELEFIAKNQVWDLVDLLNGAVAIGCK